MAKPKKETDEDPAVLKDEGPAAPEKTEVEALRDEVALLKNALAEHDEEIAVLKREALKFATPLAETHKKHLAENGHHEAGSHHHHDAHVPVHAKHLQAAHAFHERWAK